MIFISRDNPLPRCIECDREIPGAVFENGAEYTCPCGKAHCKGTMFCNDDEDNQGLVAEVQG